jgi:hypothetical protein
VYEKREEKRRLVPEEILYILKALKRMHCSSAYSKVLEALHSSSGRLSDTICTSKASNIIERIDQ